MRNRKIINALESPILRLPNFDLPFVIQTDASDIRISAVLCQDYNGTLFPVAYASKRLLDRESRYPWFGL